MSQGLPADIHSCQPSDGKPDEVLLLARVAEHDRAAFEALYRLYFVRLRRFIGKMSRQPALIEEVVDDTMLVVWRKAASYDRSCSVSTWIFAVAYRSALKAMGKERRYCSSDDSGENGDAKPRDLPCETPGPDVLLFTAQSRRVLDRLLAQLSMEHRAVVELTYFHGLAYREIATIMNCPEGTVKTRMLHARRRLREWLRQEGWEGA